MSNSEGLAACGTAVDAHTVCDAHTRSVVVVGALVSYCVPVHTVTVLGADWPDWSCHSVVPLQAVQLAWPFVAA